MFFKINIKKSQKKIFAFVFVGVLGLLLIFSMSSCVTIKIDKLKGSDNIVIKEFDIDSFERLDFSGIGKIIIKPDNVESLKVEAEDNIIKDLHIFNKGNTLFIGFKKNIIKVIPTRDIVFYLTVKNLEKINITGAGSIECDDIKLNSLSINSSGAGNIKMYLTAEKLDINISGAGKIELAGEVKTQKINISGVGNYFAQELVSNDCEIDISGAGKAIVNVIQNLDVRLSGVGKVEYLGSPSVVQNISGVGGSVQKIE